MKATEFIELVRKMRTAQVVYNKLHPHLEREKKLKQLFTMRKIEKEVDTAVVLDPASIIEGYEKQIDELQDMLLKKEAQLVEFRRNSIPNTSI